MPLPILSPLRLILPICLGLGALLTALPASADSPTPSFHAAAAETRTLVLRHADPAEVLKTLHWDQGRDLPEGVTRILALPRRHALSVTATPDGFNSLRELVALLDFAPRRVQIKFALAQATAADLQISGLHGLDLVPAMGIGAGNAAPSGFVGMASGAGALQLLRTLRLRKAVRMSPAFVTINNAEVHSSFSGIALLPGWKTFTVAASPRVNSDNSVTLRLHPAVSKRIPGSPSVTTQELQTLRTVKSGETLALINLFPRAADGLVLFVTPMVLPEGNGKRGK
jgi:hypothetical protein